MIFPRSLSRAREWEHLCGGLCAGCGSGHSLGLASAGDGPAWRRCWRAGPLVGRSGWPADEGDREPRPRRGARKSLRLGYYGFLHQRCVLKS